MPRDTLQRRILRRVLTEADRPLSPTEVLDAARERTPRLGLATVYRNLKSLVEEGKLAVVDLPGESPRYEIAGKPHHHHFHCRDCNRVYDLEGCPVVLKNLAPHGFQVESHDLTLYGVCDVCQNDES